MSASLVGSEMCIRDSCRSRARSTSSAPSGCTSIRTSMSPTQAGRTGAATVSYRHLRLPTICSV
eukprot:168043-Alexandrium_andersonii.AAC.1